MERRWFSLTNMPVQLGLLGMFVTTVLLVVLIFCSFIWFCLYVLYTSLFMLTQDPALLEQVRTMIWERASVALGTLLIVVSIGSLLTLRMTRRIAGPIYRINRELGHMLRKGEAHRISIRDDDYFQGLVDRLNGVLLTLEDENRQEVNPGSSF